MVDSNVLIQNSKLCKSAIFLITYQTSQSYNFQKQKDVTMPLFFKVVLCFEPKIVSEVKFTFFGALKQWPLTSLTKHCMGYKYKSKTSSQNCKRIRKDTLYHFLCTRKWDVWLKLTDLIWDHLDKTDFLPQPVKLKALRINWSAWAIRTEKALVYFGGF